MKKTLKLAGLLLALVMVISMMSVTAFAEGSGSITVNPPTGADTLDGSEVYHAWQMLTIESYEGETSEALADPATLTGARYYVNSTWKSFFQSYTVGEDDAAKAAFVITANADEGKDYVTLAEGVTLDMPTFAKAALAYANTNTIAATATSTENVISGLDDGWYLVDSSIGAVCMISNVAPDVIINDKNDVPTIEKEIAETDENVAINDVVTFTITVEAKDGGKNYVVTDTMSKGLTFNDDVAITFGTDTLTEDTDFTVASSTDSGTGVTTITITLPDPVADGDYEITYTATVNENAVVNGANVQQTNSAVLTYGQNSTTTSAAVDLDLDQFDIVKVDEANKYLEDAEFELYVGDTKIGVICIDETNNIYRPIVSGETAETIKAGKARIVGLDADLTYKLDETAWPAGYNPLDGKATMAFSSDDTLFASIDADYTYADTDSEKVNAIVNNKGAVLPETGGIGTTLFYVIGAILVVGAGVLLVSKKRMAAK